MLASSSVDTLTTPSQIPSEEILTYFEQQIKKNFALADISIKSGDIGEEGGYWVICMESLEAWKILYQETLVNSKKQWGKELENIPKQVANLEQELRGLPEVNHARLKKAQKEKVSLMQKRTKVKDWEGGGVIKTAEYQRKLLDQDIDQQERIIEEENYKHEKRHPLNKGIEGLKKRQKELEHARDNLGDIETLAENFYSLCQKIKVRIPPAPTIKIPEVRTITSEATARIVQKSSKSFSIPPWLNLRTIGLSLGATVLVLGGGVAAKKYQEHQEQRLAWKMARIGNYFPPDVVEEMDEEMVNRCSTLSAQIRDGNRNHGWNLSEEKIIELVRLGDPLKACMREPRLAAINQTLYNQIQDVWKDFLQKNSQKILGLCSQGKLQNILTLMREDNEVFVLLSEKTEIFLHKGADLIGIQVQPTKNFGFNFPIGHELIPERFQSLARTLKKGIQQGTIGIKDIGITEKDTPLLTSRLAKHLQIDPKKSSVAGYPLHGGEKFEIGIYNTDEESPSRGSAEICIMDTGSALREFATKNDPEGIHIMAEMYRGSGWTHQVDSFVAMAIDKLVNARSPALISHLQKIEGNFRDPHHEFPQEFLTTLEVDIHREISRGRLGALFGNENITVLCNGISADGVMVHVYICRADKVIFSGNTVMTSLGARTGGTHIHARHDLGKKFAEAFLRNPLLNVDEMKTHLSEGDLIIEPGSLIVEKTITNPNGANFAALLRYVVRTPGNGLFHEGIYIPDFGEKIGHTLLLPRGLERKTFFHPLETSAVQEGLSKIPGLSGHPHSVKQIIYKGKNRAVVSMPGAGTNLDLLLPEAEKTIADTNMTPEDLQTAEDSIKTARTNFVQHGSISQFGAELTQKISEAFRAKLANLQIQPEVAQNNYQFRIRIDLINGSHYDTLLSTPDIAAMIEKFLSRVIEEKKVLSQVDYLVQLNGPNNYRGQVQNIGHIGLLQQTIPEKIYYVDCIRSGITVNNQLEPLLRVVYGIESVRTVFSFELSAKNQYGNIQKK